MLHDTLIVKLRYEEIIKNIRTNDKSKNPKSVDQVIDETEQPEHLEL